MPAQGREWGFAAVVTALPPLQLSSVACVWNHASVSGNDGLVRCEALLPSRGVWTNVHSSSPTPFSPWQRDKVRRQCRMDVTRGVSPAQSRRWGSEKSRGGAGFAASLTAPPAGSLLACSWHLGSQQMGSELGDDGGQGWRARESEGRGLPQPPTRGCEKLHLHHPEPALTGQLV